MDDTLIQSALKRINKSLTSSLSSTEREIAISHFKELYASEMSKVTMELSKRKKVHQNLEHINTSVKEQMKHVDQELKKKMEGHEKKREQAQNNKIKEIKMGDQNWKRKMEEIQRKKKEMDRSSFKKAEEMRKEVEEYWSKRAPSQRDDQQSMSLHRSPQSSLLNPEHQTNPPQYFRKVDHAYSRTNHQSQNKTAKDMRANTYLPTVSTKKQFQTIDKHNMSSTGTTQMRRKEHKQRSQQKQMQKQEFVFQKAMQKLRKIQIRRQQVHKRVKKELEQTKKLREIRSSAEAVALRKQQSNQVLSRKSKQKNSSKQHLGNSAFNPNRSKSNLNESIVKHLSAKKKIEEEQFLERGLALESTMKRMKKGKIKRLVRDAISMLKFETLKEREG